MMSNAQRRAMHFVAEEKQFHLGVLPTEQSHPKTRMLSDTIKKSTVDGVRMLLDVDNDMPPVMRRVMSDIRFRKLAADMYNAILQGKRIFFTGCGATGRLSILLEAAWRRFWQELKNEHPDIFAKLPCREDSVISVMSGGDHALIRSVENFEDFAQFGRYQLSQAAVSADDVVVAITEGGETSFVIGTAWQGLDAGAKVFFVFNNPAEILECHVGRSREVIEEARITKLDLSTGPMAVAGSTRLQATTSELFVVGSALELALTEFLADNLDADDFGRLGITCMEAEEYGRVFECLLKDIQKPDAVQAIADITDFEFELYSDGGLVTYATDTYLLDLLTDTTERAPTFSLPPFRKNDDVVSPVSWAFVKNPLFSTPEAWREMLRRGLRGLSWDSETYEMLKAPVELRTATSRLDNQEILKFQIGNEVDASRYSAERSALVTVAVFGESSDERMENFFHACDAMSKPFGIHSNIQIGMPISLPTDGRIFVVPCNLKKSPLRLWDRLAVKIVFNTLSTATMAKMGRIDGNWMACAEATNKKLVDRGTRLIQGLTGLDYQQACIALYESLEEIATKFKPGEPKPAPAIFAVQRLRSTGIKETSRA